ncbi:MAG: hypothetical protein K9K76_11215, partial [Halanaerobiales bacterium]|nr:hypothetical protein [Halanaerobiales bacterium]
MAHVKKEIVRPEKKIIKKFREVSVASVYEASGRNGYVDCNIKPISKEFKLCGPAFTVQCAPGDNLMLHKGLSIAKEGDVLVTVTGGAYKYGYWGEMMSV